MKNLYENYFINQNFIKFILHINVENKKFLNCILNEFLKKYYLQ